ncbi:MAG: LPXTG cell wall anchor domain-containing protein, partial [Lachnospiraceae bacterium]|nr:LPXTG cell wall anchor domain-containing protein [Lachnospiraceae bacterium]
PATSPVAGASLPKTGVVSAAVLYAIGSVLVGAGVVVTKKSRKED